MEFPLPNVSIKRAEIYLPSNLIGLFTKISLKQTLECSAVASLVAVYDVSFEGERLCGTNLTRLELVNPKNRG